MSELLYEKKVTCIYCNKEFSTHRVRLNRAKFTKRDPDFCPYYEELNPIYYDVNVCPNCGLSFTDSFSKIKDKKKYNSLKENYIDKLEMIPKVSEQRNVKDVISYYKMALYAASLLEESSLIIANLGMRIAWLNRYLSNEHEEVRFLKNVLELYLEIYETQDLDSLQTDKYQLIYLIGELYGKIGEYEKVSKWFSIIIEDKNSTPKILSLCKERWAFYRERKDEAKKLAKVEI